MTSGNDTVNSWDQRYSAGGYYYGTEPNEFIRDNSRIISRGGAVLCIGEGEGRNAVYLAGQGFRVVALDQSAVGLDKARRLAEVRGVEIDTVVADLQDYRIEAARWDGIVSVWCHLPGDLRSADLLPTLAELRQDLAGLDFVRASELERIVHEGSGHNGLSAVVQIVARRSN